MDRKEELENSGVTLKEFHPYGTRSPEQLELERLQKLQEEEEQRLERERLRREKKSEYIPIIILII